MVYSRCMTCRQCHLHGKLIHCLVLYIFPCFILNRILSCTDNVQIHVARNISLLRPHPQEQNSVVQNAATVSHKIDTARKKENLENKGLENKMNLRYTVLYCVTQVRSNFLYFRMVLFLQPPLIVSFLD